MKTGLKAMLLAFIVTTMISCAFPATAMENCYVGIAGGISYANNRVQSLEGRINSFSSDVQLQLKHDEKKIGFPYELYGGCEYNTWLGFEIGKLENIKASVTTEGIIYIPQLREAFTGTFTRQAELSGWSASAMLRYKMSPTTKVFLGLGIVRAEGMLYIEHKGYIAGVKKTGIAGRVQPGIEMNFTPRTKARISASFFSKTEFAVMGGLNISF